MGIHGEALGSLRGERCSGLADGLGQRHGRYGGSVWHQEAKPLHLQPLDSDERCHYQAVMEAMRVIGFSPEEVDSVHRILAAILHLVSLTRS